MVIAGIDPSFDALSISILNTETHKVYINTFSEKLGSNIGFGKVFLASRKLWSQLSDYINTLISNKDISGIDKVFSEYPPPVAAFSAGLYALDNYILSSLFNSYESIKELYIIPSNYVGVVHGTRKYTKGESTKLANYLINEVISDKIEIIIPDSISEKGRVTKGKMNNDKAESFIFLVRAMVKYNIYDLSKVLVSEMEGLSHEGEKLLIERN